LQERTEQFALGVISGETRGIGAALLRGALRAAEPFYAGAMSLRNALYSRGVCRVHRLPRPVVSVGNLTTGGTGKTPVVAWLAASLRDAGHRPAILMRGYGGDEPRVLEDILNPDAAADRRRIPILADPDRVAAAAQALAEDASITAFLLDDGFQHRRVHRDVDLVLIDATNPFGFGHVLPRGLLREPRRGLARASAFLLTRVDQVSGEAIASIERELRRLKPGAPIYRSRHAASELLDAAGEAHSIEKLAGNRVFAFCGIGNPASFRRQLEASGAALAGFRAMGDHHRYDAGDLASLEAAAAASDAEALVTTEKDWVKLRPLVQRVEPSAAKPRLAIWRVQVQIAFDPEENQGQLLAQVTRVIGHPPSAEAGAVAGTAGGGGVNNR
jgi:tetraacyldisaccharide 4'-kinase